MKKFAVGDVVEVEIERLAVGGRGVGRIPNPDGRSLVVFVDQVAPRDQVRARVTLAKKTFLEAELVEILKVGEARIKPDCPVANVCGGCNWQHIEYSQQVTQKTQIVRETLSRIGGLSRDLVRDCLAAKNPWRYRSRIQVHRNKGKVGFFRRRSNDIVVTDDCLITMAEVAGKISEVATLPEQPRYQISAQPDHSGKVTASIQAGQNSAEFAFTQVNWEQNEVLRQQVVTTAAGFFAATDSFVLWDLYAGSGNLTLPLRQYFINAKILAVESHAGAVEHGQKLFSAAGLLVEYAIGKVEQVLAQARGQARRPSVRDGLIVLDPPRAGCEEGVVPAIARAQPRAVLYVSCNPVTLARDIALFLEQGYETVFVQPLDMFPQTDHVEAIAALRPRVQI